MLHDLGESLEGLTPAEGVKRLSELAKDAYWKGKDLARSIALAEEAIRRALTAAEADPAAAVELRGLAKAAAYNLAANTWPGWDEAGVRPTAEQMKLGRAAAELNLRLAVELNRPAEPLANAHWLVGAHAMAAGEHDAAIESFGRYRAIATTDDHRHLADGYTAIARIVSGKGGTAADRQFDAAVAELTAIGTDDARFFADQLRSVRAYFTRS